MLSSLSLFGCSEQSNETQTSNNATTANINQLQSSLSELEEKYQDVTKIYSDTLEESIKTYCDEYLSYKGSATDNVEKIKNVVTDRYYDELYSQTFHQKSKTDYEQATGIKELYYEDYSEPTNSINILAHCKQTTLYDNKVNTYNAFYTFEMTLEDDVWKINSVSNNN